GSGGSEFDAEFFGESDHAARAAFGNIKADEVASLGPGPCHIRNAGKLLVEDLEHLLEFRRDEGSVVVHQLKDACLVFQKAHMPPLIDFVRANRARSQ